MKGYERKTVKVDVASERPSFGPSEAQHFTKTQALHVCRRDKKVSLRHIKLFLVEALEPTF